MASYIANVGEFRPLKNHVFVTDLESGPTKTAGGIIIPDDNMTERGVRERWGKVWAIGPEVEDLEPGEWVLVKHGRWTEGITLDFEEEGEVKIWRVEYPESVLIACNQYPLDREKTQL